MILRISIILRRTRNIKNRFAPINRLPPETLTDIATSFAKKRDLINATAICQHWRSVLLSFPLLWCNAAGSLSEIQAYIDRSKAAPLDVSLVRPSVVDLVIPHTCRLVGLTVRLNRSSSFNQIVERLRYPIPTLHTFRISAIDPFPHILGLPADVNDSFFLHSKKLEIKGISAFDGPKSFPYVTDLTLSTNEYEMVQMNHFLETLEQLPSLERVYVVFCSDMYSNTTPHMTTLPLVQTMSLSRFSKNSIIAESLPQILGYLRLPKLTSLSVQASPQFAPFHSIYFLSYPLTNASRTSPNSPN